jgi:hypothetical protein
MMNRLRFLALVACLVWCEGLNAQSALKLGEPAGPVTLVTPQGPTISMNNYAERLGTAVLFLSTRDDGTTASADAIVTLNQ